MNCAELSVVRHRNEQLFAVDANANMFCEPVLMAMGGKRVGCVCTPRFPVGRYGTG
jgi:hypothetical protein